MPILVKILKAVPTPGATFSPTRFAGAERVRSSVFFGTVCPDLVEIRISRRWQGVAHHLEAATSELGVQYNVRRCSLVARHLLGTEESGGSIPPTGSGIILMTTDRHPADAS